MALKVRFSAVEDELLIEMVAGHPILWNMADAEFKNALKKDLIWIEIGKMVNKEEGQCKIRWRSIRDHYKRQKKNSGIGSAATKKRASYWDRLRFLDTGGKERQIFSNTLTESGNSKHIQEPKEESPSGPHSEAEDDEVSDLCAVSTRHSTENQAKRNYEKTTGAFNSQISNSRTRKVRKDNIMSDMLQERIEERLQYIKYIEKIMEPEAEDEIFLFFKAMASTVQKFDPEVKTEAKMKIFNLVTEMEMRCQRSSACVNVFKSESA